MDENQRANIVGRIVALEIMMRTILTLAASNSAKPLTEIRTWKHDTFSTLQNAERPIGEFNDLAWGHAIEALEELFQGAEQRLSRLFQE